MRFAAIAAVALAFCLAMGACGQEDEREPVAAPAVTLSDADRARWAPGPASRSGVPVLLYDRSGAEAFARHMTLLRHAGYETIGLEAFVRFAQRRPVDLPPRPLLLTFDGGRLDSWTETDATLRKLGFQAVLFVDVGRVQEGDPAYLTWTELERLQRDGRWDVQLQSGTGNYQIRYGPERTDVGPFYAYRGSEEVLGGWRERVFSDITYGEEQLGRHVRGYRPLAFAPPFGNYGQAGTNDPRIPRELLARLELSFEVVFTLDRDGITRPGARNPLGRIEIGPHMTEDDLRSLLP